MSKSVLPRARAPQLRGPPERPEHGRGGVRFSRLSKPKMSKSVLPHARAPQLPNRQRGQSTGAGGVRFSRLSRLKMPKSVLPRASSLTATERPEHGAGEYDFQISKCRSLYSPTPVPPSPDRHRGQSTGAGSTIFETFKAQNAETPHPCPPAPWAPQRGQSTGAGECDFRENAEICTPPRPCPPAPAPCAREARVRARGSTIFETFKSQNAEICTPPRPCPPRPEHWRGEYDFRDFQGSKCRNLYSPTPVPPCALDPREAMKLPHNLVDVLADAC